MDYVSIVRMARKPRLPAISSRQSRMLLVHDAGEALGCPTSRWTVAMVATLIFASAMPSGCDLKTVSKQDANQTIRSPATLVSGMTYPHPLLVRSGTNAALVQKTRQRREHPNLVIYT